MRAALLLLFVALLGFAATVPARADTQIAGRRVALVVGNGAYRNVDRLPNADSDAKLMADTLRGLGFTLVGDAAQLDLDRPRLAQAVADFGHAIIGAEVALFYYSGHGLQVQGVNWLVPIDANPTRPQDLDFQMVDADLVLRQMDGAATKLNLVLLDACRNNPFAQRGLRALQPGLAEMRAPEGTLISYATQPGNVAMDGTGANSPYTTALASVMRQPGLDIFRVFNQVGLQVKRGTDGNQQPWVSNSPIDGDFYFVPMPVTATATAAAPASPPPVPPEQAPPLDKAIHLAMAPPPTPQPAAAPPSPPDARGLVRDHPCSSLDADISGGQMKITGVAFRGPDWDSFVKRIGAANPGLRLDMTSVTFVPQFACDVLGALGSPLRQAQSDHASRFLTLGRREAIRGQAIGATVRQDASETVLIDLFQADGMVEHLLVRPPPSAGKLGETISVPVSVTSNPKSATGTHMMTVVLAPPSFHMPDRPRTEPTPAYLAALRESLDAAPDSRADLTPLDLRAEPPPPPPVRPERAVSQAPAPVRPAPPSRCAGILERAQLGETLSDADRALLRGACR